MSWHYSQELVEDYLGQNSLIGDLLQQLKLMSLDDLVLFNAKKMVASISSLYGMTLEHSTGDPFVDTWILLQVGSHVNHIHKLAQNEEKQIQEIFGQIQSELYAKFDHDTASWKMLTISLHLTISGTSSRIWPQAGTLLGTMLYQQQPLELTICVDGSGLLATPTTMGNQLTPDMMKNPGCRRLLATVLERDWKDYYAIVPRQDGQERNDTLPRQLGGPLNPEFAEWMMGWPIGWTESKQLDSGKFQLWLELHGIF